MHRPDVHEVAQHAMGSYQSFGRLASESGVDQRDVNVRLRGEHIWIERGDDRFDGPAGRGARVLGDSGSIAQRGHGDRSGERPVVSQAFATNFVRSRFGPKPPSFPANDPVGMRGGREHMGKQAQARYRCARWWSLRVSSVL